MILLLLLVSICYPYESSDVWEGPENFEEFMEYHNYSEDSKRFVFSEEYPEYQTSICEEDEVSGLYFCYKL